MASSGEGSADIGGRAQPPLDVGRGLVCAVLPSTEMEPGSEGASFFLARGRTASVTGGALHSGLCGALRLSRAMRKEVSGGRRLGRDGMWRGQVPSRCLSHGSAWQAAAAGAGAADRELFASTFDARPSPK